MTPGKGLPEPLRNFRVHTLRRALALILRIFNGDGAGRDHSREINEIYHVGAQRANYGHSQDVLLRGPQSRQHR